MTSLRSIPVKAERRQGVSVGKTASPLILPQLLEKENAFPLVSTAEALLVATEVFLQWPNGHATVSVFHIMSVLLVLMLSFLFPDVAVISTRHKLHT